jgi:putative acetyltransferase
MIKFLRTNSDNTDFIELVKHLDAYLDEQNGTEQQFYAQYNKIDTINHVIVAYENDQAIGCGAIKEYYPGTMEVKRMYTMPGNRGNGIATGILNELEKWAGELSYTKCILETGKKLEDAVNLYQKNNYKAVPNYGQYAGVEDSVCFEKEIE